MNKKEFIFNWLPLIYNVNLNEDDFIEDLEALLQKERERCAKKLYTVLIKNPVQLKVIRKCQKAIRECK